MSKIRIILCITVCTLYTFWTFFASGFITIPIGFTTLSNNEALSTIGLVVSIILITLIIFVPDYKDIDELRTKGIKTRGNSQ